MTCMKRSEPLEVTFEIVRVTGPEAEALAVRQAQVIDEVLRWLASRAVAGPPGQADGGHGE